MLKIQTFKGVRRIQNTRSSIGEIFTKTKDVTSISVISEFKILSSEEIQNYEHSKLKTPDKKILEAKKGQVRFYLFYII